MSRDIQTLSKAIHLPGQPEKVWWQRATIGKQGGLGPDDWYLIAVMKFKKNDLETIIHQSQTISGDLTLQPSHVFAWFPEELKKIMSPLPDGSFKIQSAGFDPAPFVRSPLLHGFMLKVDDATLFLILGTS